MPTVFLLNGPNANLYGLDAQGAFARTYGREDFPAIGARCHRAAERVGLLLDFRQTNDEGQLIDWVQEARTAADGLLINATSLSYTSIAVMDAMLMLDCPVIEIHMFNIHRGEPFRHKTFTSLAATASLCGLGPLGYELAIGAMADLIAAGCGR
jgi:3-dehydroquinate dehydratase-2